MATDDEEEDGTPADDGEESGDSKAASLEELVTTLANRLTTTQPQQTDREVTSDAMARETREQLARAPGPEDGITAETLQQYRLLLKGDLQHLDDGRYTLPNQVRIQDDRLPLFSGMTGERTVETFQADVTNLFSAQNRVCDIGKAKMLAMYLTHRARLEYDKLSEYTRKSYFLSIEALVRQLNTLITQNIAYLTV